MSFIRLILIIFVIFTGGLGYLLYNAVNNSSVGSCSYDVDRTNPTKVLFIGNSYTFYHDMPKMAECIAGSNGDALEVKMIVEGGENIKGHWQKGKALKAIKEKNWDFVVLQEQSLGAMYKYSRGEFLKYARLFADEINKTGAKTLIFVPWARDPKGNWYKGKHKDVLKNFSYMQTTNNNHYKQAAYSINGSTVPVGYYWEKTLKNYPTFSLYMSDGSHPSIYGSYLTALAFYKNIFWKNPQINSWKPSKIKKEEAEYLIKTLF